jgi:gas vesicle protein
MRSCNSGAAVGAFLGGALLGGAIALLFAPRSGAETRGMIRDFVDDEIDMVKDKAAAARDYVEGEVAKYARKAQRTVGRVEHKLENALEDAAHRVENEIGVAKRAVAQRVKSL